MSDTPHKPEEAGKPEKLSDVNERIVSKLVDKFLSWKLPLSVCSDPCVTVAGYHYRRGTELLSAAEAREMILHLVGPALSKDAMTEAEGESFMQGFYEGGVHELERIKSEDAARKSADDAPVSSKPSTQALPKSVADLKPGDILVDNDPRMKGRRLTVVRVTNSVVVARDFRGRERCYMHSRIFCDGAPRSYGFSVHKK